MNSQETTMQGAQPSSTGRVTEFELRLPRREELRLPSAEPLRRVAKDVVLTGIGFSVLAGRAVMNTLQAAHNAGQEAAEHPGSLTRALVDLVSPKPVQTKPPLSRNVPVLPIADYGNLSAEEILTRLEGLTQEQLRVLREYEEAHEKRAEVLEALDARLATA